MKTFLMILMAVMFGNVAYAGSVPFWFTANTPARATEVNQNFNYLTNNAAYAGMRSVKTTDASGVALATCAATEFAVGGGCYCTGMNSSGTNYGVLFACSLAGNSYVGGCFPDSSFDYLLPVSPIEVTVICMSSVSNTSIAPSIASGTKLTPATPALSDESSAETLMNQLRQRLNERISTR